VNLDITTLARHALSLSRDCYFFCFSQACYIDDANFRLVVLPRPSSRLRFAIVNPQVQFIPMKAQTVFGRVKSAGQRRDVARDFFRACLHDDVEALQRSSYNFITPELMPEYAKAFALRAQAKARLGMNLVMSGTGPFLTMPFVGESLRDLEELCRHSGATVSYAGILYGRHDTPLETRLA
jgi:4-diphosphocytidyl-2C-methyl-D-erythritol kinase